MLIENTQQYEYFCAFMFKICKKAQQVFMSFSASFYPHYIIMEKGQQTVTLEAYRIAGIFARENFCQTQMCSIAGKFRQIYFHAHAIGRN